MPRNNRFNPTFFERLTQSQAARGVTTAQTPQPEGAAQSRNRLIREMRGAIMAVHRYNPPTQSYWSNLWMDAEESIVDVTTQRRITHEDIQQYMSAAMTRINPSLAMSVPSLTQGANMPISPNHRESRSFVNWAGHPACDLYIDLDNTRLLHRNDNEYLTRYADVYGGGIMERTSVLFQHDTPASMSRQFRREHEGFFGWYTRQGLGLSSGTSDRELMYNEASEHNERTARADDFRRAEEVRRYNLERQIKQMREEMSNQTIYDSAKRRHVTAYSDAYRYGFLRTQLRDARTYLRGGDYGAYREMYDAVAFAYRETKRVGVELAEHVRALLRGGIDEYEFIEAAGRLSASVRGGWRVSSFLQNALSNVVEALEDRTELRKCPDCGDLYHSDEACYVDGGDNVVCETCRDDHYNYSECMDTYIDCDEVFAVYHDQRSFDRREADVATRSWCRSEGYYWDEYREAYINPDEVDTGDQDDDDDDDMDGLADYHGSSRRWVTHDSEPRKNRPPLGVELEVYNEDRRDMVRKLKYDFSSIGTLRLERDGSLSDSCGFEIITDPLGYKEWQQFGPKLCDYLTKGGTIGYKVEGQYGIHVNVGRDGLSALQEARIFQFHVAQKNRDFLVAIAQRAYIYGSGTNIGSRNDNECTVEHLGGLSVTEWDHDNHKPKQKKIRGTGKYCPIAVKDTVLEFRMFRSTLASGSFMKNLEFVWALVEWTGQPSGTSYDYRDFVLWLGKRPNARKDFPALMAWLMKPTYGARDLRGRIDNQWAKYLPKPKLQAEEMVDNEDGDKSPAQVPLPLVEDDPSVEAMPQPFTATSPTQFHAVLTTNY